jgi:biotin operon repressor
MRHAKVDKSPRLQRVYALLMKRKAGWVSTRNIMLRANVCAVNSCIAELRANGCDIECEQRNKNGQRVWYYRLTKGLEKNKNA